MLALGLPSALSLLALSFAPEPALQWTAPPGCPDEAAVVGAVEHYLQRPLADEALRGVAEVQVTDAGDYRLQFDLIAGSEAPTSRTLSDPDCRVLADAAALMLAIGLDPEAANRADEQVLAVNPQLQPAPEPVQAVPEPEPEPELATPSEPAPVPEPERPKATPRSCRPGPSLLRQSTGDRNLRPSCAALSAGFTIVAGLLPRLGPGVRGVVAALWPRLRLSLGVEHDFRQAARTDEDTALGGDLRLTVAQGLACGRLGVRRAEFPLCGGVELGAMRGQGVGVQTPRADRLFWSAAVLQAGVGFVPTRRFGLRLDVAAVVPFADYAFAVGGLGTIHEPTVVGLRSAISAELRLP